ncbi:MAG: hypothetical protein ACOY94_18850 [Bacillota bacterium]
MRGNGKRVRMWMEQAKAGELSPMDLFPRLARTLKWVWTGLPAGPTDLDWRAVLFTQREVARVAVRGEHVTLRRVDPLRALVGAMRTGRERVVIDPGLPSRLALSRPLIRLLFREYALLSMERRGGAWVLTRKGQVQAGAVRNRAPYVPIYLTRADAVPQVGEVAAFRRWPEIRQGCLEASTDRLLLHAGRPEQIPLHRGHLSRLEGRSDVGPLARLERAMIRRQGMFGSAEVSGLLANLEWIWAPVLSGEVVSVRPERNVIDLFTSANHAEGFLLSAHCPVGELVQPRLVPTRPLFERLIRSRTPVAINAGWAHQWQAHFETLEPVLSAGVARSGRGTAGALFAGSVAGLSGDWLQEE